MKNKSEAIIKLIFSDRKTFWKIAIAIVESCSSYHPQNPDPDNGW